MNRDNDPRYAWPKPQPVDGRSLQEMIEDFFKLIKFKKDDNREHKGTDSKETG